MAQRNSAPANDPGAPRDPVEAPAASESGRERRRAAAYLDLWERQLTYAAAQATPPTAAARKGPKAGA